MTSQPNPTRTNEQTFYVKPDGANINVPVPIPASLGCAAPECKNIFGRGPWRGVVDRHRKLTEHFDKFHGRGTKHTMTFTCCNCRADIGSNLLSANKHASSGSSPPPSLPAFNPPPTGIVSTEGTTATPTSTTVIKRLPDGSKGIVLRYPATGGAVSCPICQRVFQSRKTAGMNSVFRHLETVHDIAERTLVKLWTCPTCEVDISGNVIASHFATCGRTAAPPSLLDQGPTTPSVLARGIEVRVLRPRTSNISLSTSRRTPLRASTRLRPVSHVTPSRNSATPSLSLSRRSLPRAASTPKSPRLPSVSPQSDTPPPPSQEVLAGIEEEREVLPLVLEDTCPPSHDDRWLHSIGPGGSLNIPPLSMATPNLDARTVPPPPPGLTQISFERPPARSTTPRPALHQQNTSGQSKAQTFFHFMGSATRTIPDAGGPQYCAQIAEGSKMRSHKCPEQSPPVAQTNLIRPARLFLALSRINSPSVINSRFFSFSSKRETLTLNLNFAPFFAPLQ